MTTIEVDFPSGLKAPATSWGSTWIRISQSLKWMSQQATWYPSC